MNVFVQFPDAESRQAALALLGADAALGVEGWNGRHVMLTDSLMRRLDLADIPFTILHLVNSDDRETPSWTPFAGELPTGWKIDRMSQARIGFVHEAVRVWGGNVSFQEWELANIMEPRGCFIATWGGQLIGVISSVLYLNRFGWIGEFHVCPGERLEWAESALLDRALAYLDGCVNCVEAQADETGCPLFEQRGFEVVERINRWRIRRNSARSQLHPCVRGFRTGDIARIISLDQKAVGVLRGRGLFDLPGAGEDLPLVYERPNSRLTGFGCVRRGGFADRIGPVIAEDPMVARLIVSTLLLRIRDRPVWWDIPEANQPANDMARELGFHMSDVLFEVRRGKRLSQCEQELVYATGGPLMG